MQENEKVKSVVTLNKRLLIILICIMAMFTIVVGTAAGFIGYRALNQSARLPTTYTVHTSIQDTPIIVNGDEGDIVGVVNAVASSVVEIRVQTTALNEYNQVVDAVSAGSGVIISANGAIITNNHVVDGAKGIAVTMRDGAVYEASLIATDAKTDIAVISINAQSLPYAVFGDSANLQVGQTVVAIGNPLGTLGGSVTSGIVSALDREINVDGTTMRLLQTSAAINPGNSGGGLFNLSGELIGIVNAKSTGEDIEGLGFAIPSNTALAVATELMERGYISGRVSSGLDVLYISDRATLIANRLTNEGLYVNSITGSNASEFMVKDLIVSVNGTAMDSSAAFTQILDNSKIGDTLTLIVVRSSKTLTLTIVLEEYLPANFPASLAA